MPYTLVSEALLRSPMAPDPDADQGPQQGIQTTLIIGASVEDAIREGYRINAPVRTVEGVAAGGRIEPLVSVIDGSAVIEAVKLADDRSGDLIVRLYEALGDQTRAVLQLDPALVSSGAWLDATSAVLTDALEEPLLAGGGETPGTRSIDLAVSSDGRIEVALTPFQIRTVRVRGEVLIH
jgi:alpha-mannosidase